MAFVNEYIPKEDLEKLKVMFEKRRRFGATFWTIDRENDIWLHHLHDQSDHTEPDGGYTGVSYWDYYWKGYLMTVKIKVLEYGGKVREDYWERKKLLDISLPAELKDKRDFVLKDLDLALAAFGDNGVFSKCTNYKLIFEY